MSSIDRIVRSYRSLRLLCVPIGAESDVLEGWHRSLGVARHRPKALDPASVALDVAPRPTQFADSVCTQCCPAQVSAIMAPRSDKYIDKAVRLVVDSGYTPREAYEAVPQLQEAVTQYYRICLEPRSQGAAVVHMCIRRSVQRMAWHNVKRGCRCRARDSVVDRIGGGVKNRCPRTRSGCSPISLATYA